MRNWIRVFCCYIGALPPYFRLFYDSCRNNSWIDWAIVTDSEWTLDDHADNVRFIHMTLEEIESRIKSRIGNFAELKRGYKLCDYRPAYAVIFSEYLDGYTHWGFCDCDTYFGDLRKFITPEMLSEYDKVFSFGHLSILKNNDECNNAFRLQSVNSQFYQKVFADPNSCWFDEYRGINELLVDNGYQVYTGIDFFDISDVYQHSMSVADERIVRMFFPKMHCEPMHWKQNFGNQLFMIDDGRVLRAVCEHGIIRYEEAAYIHFRRKIDIQEYVNFQAKSKFAFSMKKLESLSGAPTLNDIKAINGKVGAKDYRDYKKCLRKRKAIIAKAKWSRILHIEQIKSKISSMKRERK